MKSLQVKMTIMIVLVVLVVSGLVSFISFERARESMSSQLEENYSVAADKYAQELTAWINTNATITDTLATEISVSHICEGDRSEFHRFLNECYNKLNTDGYIYDFYFTYPDNTMACASDFVPDGSVDYAHDREWFVRAAETGELFYSTPYKDSDTGCAIVTISKAVYKDGVLQGVLAADIFVDTLVKIISEADLAKDSYAFLVDQNMNMVVHPYSAYSYEDEPHGVMDIPASPYGAVVKNIRSGSKDTVYVEDYDGTTRGIVVSKLNNIGWYVGIATSKAELLSGLSALIRGFLIAALIAIFIGGTIAVFLAHVLDRLSKQQQEYEAQVLKLEKQVADEASKAKSKFLADMSHEIRTPINAILGMNEMIMRESKETETKEYAGNIKSAGRNLLQLVNSILDFSKIEDGKMEIVPVRYSVSTVIRYLVNSVKERARANGLEFNVIVDPAIPSELFGDDVRLDQIIVNLLTNAVKYTPRGSVTLKMEVKEWRDDEILLHVLVKDTGIGIKESDMKRLFEPFERVDVIRNRNIEGTGLGISITMELLGLMGSELKVKSVYGEGSEFSFEVWQKIENREPVGDYREAVTADEAAESYHEAFHAPDARILIVDDTRMNIVVAVKLLSKTEIMTDTALSGQEAVRLCDKTAYDLIFMDQRMPSMDGTETLKAIRDLESGLNKETPVVCLTADAISGAKERYLAEGFCDYLTKPVEGSELEKTLIKFLPKEKMISVEPENEEKKDIPKEETGFITELNRAGLSTSNGMIYCQNEPDVYKMVLSVFAQDHRQKSENLNRYYREKNWNDYAIIIHSVKSSAKTIGAMELSDRAAQLEKASRAGDEIAIMNDHENVMLMYGHVAGIIKEILDVDDRSDDKDDNDDEILEFFPEE